MACFVVFFRFLIHVHHLHASWSSFTPTLRCWKMNLQLNLRHVSVPGLAQQLLYSGQHV